VSAERLDDLAKSFSRDLRAANKSARTIKIYNESIRFFGEWLRGQGRSETTESLTKGAISAWLADLAQDHAPNTVLTHFRGMRRFTRWAVQDGTIERHPMAGMEMPKVPEKPVPVLGDSEIATLLKQCDGKTFEGRRNEAILRVLFDCGLRIAELASLEVPDIDMDHEVVHVVGKGRRPRSVPFGAKTARALDRYARVRRQHRHAAKDAWWLGQRGGMSVDGIDKTLRALAQKAGLDGVHAHRFRHTFAHDWLANGGQERDLMRLAGWRTDTMLSVYGASAATERAHAAARKLGRGDRV
jgi:site-specific recombinase XerD